VTDCPIAAACVAAAEPAISGASAPSSETPAAIWAVSAPSAAALGAWPCVAV
jgi:hypothetical protein